jgi:hypothetical protein
MHTTNNETDFKATSRSGVNTIVEEMIKVIYGMILLTMSHALWNGSQPKKFICQRFNDLWKMKGLKTPKRDKKPTQFHPQLIKLNPN